MSSLIEQQFREHFRAKWSLWAAVGAGCLVGVSGLILMQRLSLRVDNSVCIASCGTGANVSKELASLHSTLKELRQEIQELRSKPPLRSALRTPTVKFESIMLRTMKLLYCIMKRTPPQTQQTIFLPGPVEALLLQIIFLQYRQTRMKNSLSCHLKIAKHLQIILI